MLSNTNTVEFFNFLFLCVCEHEQYIISCFFPSIILRLITVLLL